MNFSLFLGGRGWAGRGDFFYFYFFKHIKSNNLWYINISNFFISVEILDTIQKRVFHPSKSNFIQISLNFYYKCCSDFFFF